MRTLLLVVMVIGLFATAAFAENKPPAKLKQITGYGDYKLGTSISKYDLTGFDAPAWNSVYSTDEMACFTYHTQTTFRASFQTITVSLLLQVVNEKLEGISIYTDSETSPQFVESGALTAFALALKLKLLEKYSRELVTLDDFAAGTYSYNQEGCKKFVLTDKDGNSLTLFTLEPETLDISYKSALLSKLWDAGITRTVDEIVNGDAGKL